MSTALYIIEVRRRGEAQDEIMEIPAPNFMIAAMMLATQFPGVQIVRLVGIHTGDAGNA